MKASAVIKRPGEVKGVVSSPMSINANVSRLGGASVIVDTALDPTSTNPVENKAIAEAIETINGNVSSLGNALDTLSGVVDGKYDASNPNGYISGISGNDVKTALGYTPYNATNPNGYVNATQAANAAPVQSVNGSTGAVTIAVPTKVSQLTNDSGFVNASGAASAAPVQSVNGQTGVVILSIPTVPSNVSAFTNDAGYLTLADLPVYSGGVQ